MTRLLRARRFIFVLLCGALSALCQLGAQDSTQPRTVDLRPFQVVGIDASTNNAKEAGPDAIIGKLWRQFLSEGVLNKIPGRVDQSITVVYTDYTDGVHGQYTIVLGAKVRPVPNPVIPEGMVVKTVPAGKYVVFTSQRGPGAKVVPETWKRIWAYFQNPQNGERAYQADFEVYGGPITDPASVQVDIYVGVK